MLIQHIFSVFFHQIYKKVQILLIDNQKLYSLSFAIWQRMIKKTLALILVYSIQNFTQVKEQIYK